MVRLLCLTFYGKNRSDEHTRHHLHETSAMMWAPLVVLAVLSLAVGYLGVPNFLAEIFGGSNLFEHYLAKVVHVPNVAFWSFTQEHHPASLEWTMMLASTALALSSAGLAFFLYRRGPTPFLARAKVRYAGVHRLLLNKYWVDEFYETIIINPLKELSDFLWRIVDIRIINGFINFVGRALMFLSGLTSFQISGGMQRYAVVFMIGLVGLIFLVIR